MNLTSCTSFKIVRPKKGWWRITTYLTKCKVRKESIQTGAKESGRVCAFNFTSYVKNMGSCLLSIVVLSLCLLCTRLCSLIVKWAFETIEIKILAAKIGAQAWWLVISKSPSKPQDYQAICGMECCFKFLLNTKDVSVQITQWTKEATM